MTTLNQLPANLPKPEDDGRCDHLQGKVLPKLSLAATDGRRVDISSWKCVVVYCYPMTGKPGESLPDGWDQIPGARGCTPQSCSFRDHYQELQSLGSEVYGLSTQPTDYQREAKERLHLPFELLTDESLEFVTALDLPTFEVEGMTLIKRLTLIIDEGTISKVFYPVFPPDKNADEVIEYLIAINA